jgi:hypothetical protein
MGSARLLLGYQLAPTLSPSFRHLSNIGLPYRQRKSGLQDDYEQCGGRGPAQSPRPSCRDEWLEQP